MKVYIAGKSGKAGNVRALSSTLARQGISCIHSWTGFGPEDGRTEQGRWRICLKEVAEADAVVIVYSEDIAGAIFEAGYARALGKPVYVLCGWGEYPRSWIKSPEITEVHSADQLVEVLLDWAVLA